MGDFSVICGLSGLPITRKEKVKLVFLRSTSDPEETSIYWLPSFKKEWKPLMIPVEGVYNDHAWIEEIPNSSAVSLLLKYFSKEEIQVFNPQTGKKQGDFNFPEGDFDKMIDAFFEKHPRYKDRSHIQYHSMAIVSETAFNFAIKMAEEHFCSRNELKELFESSLQNYLCPFYPRLRLAQRVGLGEINSTEEYFAKGHEPISDPSYTDECRELHARCIANEPNHFLYSLKRAMEAFELPYITYTQTQEKKLLEDMIDMILLKQIMGEQGLQKRFQPLSTYDIYDPEFKTIFIPWNEFVVSEAKRKQEFYEPEIEDEEE